MVKINGPLHSDRARKQLGHNIVFKSYTGRNIGTNYSKPGSVRKTTRSANQADRRVLYGEAVQAWRALSTNAKQAYNDQANGEAYSGYNLFMQGYFADNPVFGMLAWYGERNYGVLIYGNT